MDSVTSLHLIVFAKAPVAGQAKTRLIPALGAAGAAALAERLLDHTLAACTQARAQRAGVAIELCTTPDTSHPAFQRQAQARNLVLSSQGEGDLGERMDRALSRALSRTVSRTVSDTLSHSLIHAPAVVLLGTDAPALDAAMLLQAGAALNEHDAVFVPALDGGYALVGLRRPAPELFHGMTWSTPDVMAHTRERARQAGLRWAELPAVADIDLPVDLVHLPRGWLP